MTRRDEMIALADELDGWRNACTQNSSGGDGQFRIECSSGSEAQARGLRSALKHAAQALRLSQAEPGYVVKPLEWRTNKGDDFCDVHYDSDAIGGSYTIEARKNGSFDLWKPNAQVERYASLDDAKSAAQADYEQRIRSAITATVGTSDPGYVAGFEACREAAKNVARMAAKRCVREGVPGDGAANFIAQQLDAIELDIAALPAPATASAGWQPIETARKDGANVLISEDVRGSCGEAYYDVENKRWFWANTHAGDYPDPHEPFPTHWMPLPAAPTKRSATDFPNVAFKTRKRAAEAALAKAEPRS